MADEDGHDRSPQDARTSIFRAAAVSRYQQGTATPEPAPVIRPQRLRWLWLALAVTVAFAAWVGARPVPTFVDARVALLAHDCDELQGDIVVAVEESARVGFERGRRVIVDDAEGGQQQLRIVAAGQGPLDPGDIGERLGCEVDAAPLPSGEYLVGVARVQGTMSAPVLAPSVAMAHVEVASRPLASLLPIWSSPAGETEAPEPAPAAGVG